MPIEVNLELAGEPIIQAGCVNPGNVGVFEGRYEVVVVRCNAEDDGGQIYTLKHDQLVPDIRPLLGEENLVAEIGNDGEEDYSFTSYDGIEIAARAHHLTDERDLFEHEDVDAEDYETDKAYLLKGEDLHAGYHYRARARRIEEIESLSIPEFEIYMQSVRHRKDGSTRIKFRLANPKFRSLRVNSQVLEFPDDGLLQAQDDGSTLGYSLIESGYFLPALPRPFKLSI
jgi:hypothetical protein